ncbi:MAG: hypothetical protein ACRDN9_21750, partial [Streptosporangiaceae bacterium]
MIVSYRYRRRWSVLLAAMVVAATSVACTTQGDAGHHRPTGHHSARGAGASHSSDSYSGARRTGCGGTPVRRGDPASWASGKRHGFRGANQIPYAVSTHGRVVAYLWGYPLAVRHMGSKRDKILWFVRRDAGPLYVHGHPVGGVHPVFSETVGGAGADGMPSYVKVPAAGCWRFTLTWSGSHGSTYRDTISLRYVA